MLTLHSTVRRARIRLSIAAWAYENAQPIMTDQEYDKLSYYVHDTRKIATNHRLLDKFFRDEFDPHTGLWIHDHPDKEGLMSIYYRIFNPRPRRRRKRRR